MEVAERQHWVAEFLDDSINSASAYFMRSGLSHESEGFLLEKMERLESIRYALEEYEEGNPKRKDPFPYIKALKLGLRNAESIIEQTIVLIFKGNLSSVEREAQLSSVLPNYFFLLFELEAIQNEILPKFDDDVNIRNFDREEIQALYDDLIDQELDEYSPSELSIIIRAQYHSIWENFIIGSKMDLSSIDDNINLDNAIIVACEDCLSNFEFMPNEFCWEYAISQMDEIREIYAEVSKTKELHIAVRAAQFFPTPSNQSKLRKQLGLE